MSSTKLVHNPDDRERIVSHALGRIGHGYDFKNVIDLPRDRLSGPSLAVTIKRESRRLGSGESTLAICSTLIAQAFQSVQYPVLPRRRTTPRRDASSTDDCVEETWEAQRFSMFAPRDFDVSPYFAVIKPPPLEDFDYTRVRWAN